MTLLLGFLMGLLTMPIIHVVRDHHARKDDMVVNMHSKERIQRACKDQD